MVAAARIFCLQDTLHLQPPCLISAFRTQPENHHAYGYRRSLSLRWQKGRGLAMKSGSGDGMTRPKDEINEEKCDGVAEESKEDIDATEKVELLEMEAIMGKDDGREAMDYKRRAGIFYKSSEMFQAIKDDQHHQQGCVGS